MTQKTKAIDASLVKCIAIIEAAITIFQGSTTTLLYVVGVLYPSFFNTPAFPFVNCTFIYCQEMFHTLIAVDRYLKFRHPTEQVV